ncbi:MAG TPA: PAS domain-containing protein, partial [Steroidobacteraceae bacterium]
MHAPDQADLLTLLGTGLAVIGADLCVNWLNPALGEVLDVGPRTAVGQPLPALMRESSLASQLERTLLERRPFNLRGATFGVARGREITADLTMQPLDDGRLLVE